MSRLQVVIPVYNPQAVSGFLKFLRFFGRGTALSFHKNRHKSPGFRISEFSSVFFDVSEVEKPSETEMHSY